MCQSSVFLLENGEEKEIKRDVILVEPTEGGTKIQGFFESPEIIPARIKTIDLLKHRIILEPIDSAKDES
ncbi:MAG: CooT family nickel-binding protein [Thermodesulfobacteria bacterium]|nr:CooT family nickel-binding protein [Thermodesulfobacteriota bacterium]